MVAVRSSLALSPSDDKLQAILDDSVRQENSKTPMRVDDKLRLDSVISRPGNILMYNYTYTAKASFERKKAYVDEVLRPMIRSRTLASQDQRIGLGAGIVIIHRFRDVDRRFLGDVLISAADLKGP
jgi:hypothetical protein